MRTGLVFAISSGSGLAVRAMSAGPSPWERRGRGFPLPRFAVFEKSDFGPRFSESPLLGRGRGEASPLVF